MFDRSFLIALSNWQKGWNENQAKRRELADALVKACDTLPDNFKNCKVPCFRKRFIVGGEIVPIILEDNYFEGIASWTTDIECAKKLKGLINPATSFAIVFKQLPRKVDVIVNINELWLNQDFENAVQELKKTDPELAYPLLNFKDYQSEVVLRTTLKGTEIEHIVGVSTSFENICDMAGIPEEDREMLSIQYAQDPEGIPIEMPILASSNATREAVKSTIIAMKELIRDAKKNDVPIYNIEQPSHPDDLKHKIE